MTNNSSLRSGRTRRFKAEINVVPYIDVMLVLLVIFMVTAPMMPPGVVDLPSAGRSNTRPDVYVEVMVRESGELRVRTRNAGESLERTVALREIGEAVREVGGQNLPVVISGDKGVRYESVVNVMDQLQRANIGRVALMVKPSGN